MTPAERLAEIRAVATDERTPGSIAHAYTQHLTLALCELLALYDEDMRVLARVFASDRPGADFSEGFDAYDAMKAHFGLRVAEYEADPVRRAWPPTNWDQIDPDARCGDRFPLDDGRHLVCIREAAHGMHKGDGYEWTKDHDRMQRQTETGVRALGAATERFTAELAEHGVDQYWPQEGGNRA